MAISVHVSSPAQVLDDNFGNNDLTATTAAFSPPISVLVACVFGDTAGSYGNVNVAMSNNGSALTWTQTNIRTFTDAGATAGYASAHVAVLTGSRTNMTVTANVSPVSGAGTQNRSVVLKLYVLEGADAADVIGGLTEGSSTTNNLTTGALTAETDGMLFAVGNDWNALGVPSSSDLTIVTYHNGSIGSALSGFKQVTAGSGKTANLNAGGTGSADWNWITFEIRADAGGGDTEMVADSGSFSLTGTAADFERGLVMVAAPGSFALAGTAAVLARGFTIAADAGSFALVGTAADLQRGLVMAADAGSFTLTGTAADLERGLVMAADAGVFALVGTDATLESGLTLSADSGSFTLAGTAVTFQIGHFMVADSGTFSLVGTDAALESGLTLSADVGVFTLTGTDVALQHNRLMDAASGTFTLTGTDAALESGLAISADAGVFSIVGTEVTFQLSRVLVAAAGSFTLIGPDVSLETQNTIVVDEGSYALVGQDVVFTVFNPDPQPGPINPTDVITEVGTFVSPAGAEFQVVPLSFLKWGFRVPTAVIIWHAGKTSNDVTTGYSLGFGFGISGPLYGCMINFGEHGKPTTNARRKQRRRVAELLDFDANTLEDADFISFGVAEFTLRWNSAEPAANIYNYMVIGGSAVTDVDITEVTSPASAGPVPVTGLGFKPDSLVGFTVGSTNFNPDSWSIPSIGFANITDQVMMWGASENGRPTSDAARQLVSGQFLGLTSNDAPDGPLTVATVDSLDADGYTLDWSVGSANRIAFILALKGPKFAIVTDTQPTSISQTTTRLGLSPRGGLLLTAMGAASATVENDFRFGIGAADAAGGLADKNVFAGAVDQDDRPTSNTASVQDSGQAMLMLDHTPATKASATVAFLPADAVLDWDTVDAVEREWTGWFVGTASGIEVDVGAFALAGTAVTFEIGTIGLPERQPAFETEATRRPEQANEESSSGEFDSEGFSGPTYTDKL